MSVDNSFIGYFSFSKRNYESCFRTQEKNTIQGDTCGNISRRNT